MCRDQWPGWAILRHALPLGITALLVSLTSSLPRYLIGQRVSVEALGIFCSLAAVMQAGTLVFRALEQPAAPGDDCSAVDDLVIPVLERRAGDFEFFKNYRYPCSFF